LSASGANMIASPLQSARPTPTADRSTVRRYRALSMAGKSTGGPPVLRPWHLDRSVEDAEDDGRRELLPFVVAVHKAVSEKLLRDRGDGR
jgi:hypothetical protein